MNNALSLMVARMFVGEEATLTGWGRQWHNGPLADQLEMVRLPVVSNEECMRWYNSSGSRQFIPTYTFLCAGYEEGVLDACSGDSGGPLVIDRWAGTMPMVVVEADVDGWCRVAEMTAGS